MYREVATASKGRCLVAARAIKPGTEVRECVFGQLSEYLLLPCCCRSPPIPSTNQPTNPPCCRRHQHHPQNQILSCAADAHAVSPAERESRCHRCLQQASSSPSSSSTNTSMMRCSRCGWQRYCGRRCQQADWAEHKFECRALSRLRKGRRSPGPTLLMTARLVRRVVLEGGDEKGPLARALARLMHHEDRLPEARRKLMGEMAALVREVCLTRATEQEDPAAHAFDARVESTLARLGGLDYVVRFFFFVSI